VKAKLPYGKTSLEIDLPDEGRVTVVEPRHVEGCWDQAGAVRDALCRPIGSPPLRDLVKASDRVGIVINDITRATPYPIILPVLLEEINHVPDTQIILFNATGTHRANTEAELRGMLGEQIVNRYRIVQNDATDRDSHVKMGTTTTGNDVWIHGEFMACDVRIPTGFIEPHFFAGFSGGGKAIVPGLARLETVMRNHSAKNLDSPQARWGITQGNPLWEELSEAAAMARPTFLLNVTLNREKKITRVFAGDSDAAHREGCAFVKETAMVPVAQPFDIVITSNSGYPLDLNLYQAVKGMSAASEVVREGGSIVIAADCWDGIPGHGEYGQLLHNAESLESLLETIRTPGFQKQDMWQAHIHALICLKADVYLHTHNLSDNQIIESFLRPCHDIEATVYDLLQKYGPNATICVLPEGPQTIPYVRTG
jgi:nickel-dependent lactate racemase